MAALSGQGVISHPRGRGGRDPHAAGSGAGLWAWRRAALGAAGVLPFGGGDSRVDGGEGAGRERDLARAEAEKGTKLPELGPSLARDEVSSWVAVTVKVRHCQQEEQGLPLGGGAEMVVDLLHNLRVSGARWEGEH